MRTITQYLRYNLTNIQIAKLKRKGVINGIGGEGGYDFGKLLNRIGKLKYFDEKKVTALYKDIESLANEHDIDYYKGSSIIGFLRANYYFTIGVIALLHWCTFIERYILLFTLFTGLNIFGIRYYNFGKKKTLLLTK